MPITQAITVHSELDVVIARLQVREAARRVGLSLVDQAHISIATSSIAKALNLGKNDAPDDHILIEILQKDLQRGVRVTCRRTNSRGETLPRIEYLQEGWSINEVKTQQPSTNSIEVTLTKWA